VKSPAHDHLAVPVDKRSRWQIVPATLQFFFGGVGLIGAFFGAWEIWSRHELSKSMAESDWIGTSLENYAASDTPYWSIYVLLGNSLASVLLILGGYRRNKTAIAATLGGIAFSAVVQWWVRWRFPGLY
jgi:hypothetical protein